MTLWLRTGGLRCPWWLQFSSSGERRAGPRNGGGRRSALAQDAILRPEGLGAHGDRESRLDLLASRAAHGDKVAFELLYQQTVAEIYGYLVGLTRDAVLAEDLTASVFLKAWASARSYRAGTNRYRRWLFTIAHNELRDTWRRQRRGLQVELSAAGNLADATEPLTPEDHRQVLAALQSLTEEQRRVVILRFFGEQSHAEIAAILKKREGAVRTQLLRALRHMRKVMDDAAP